jgi:hypothetical protein
MSDRMVVIKSFSNEFDAQLARAELEAANIASQLLSDGTGGVHPHLQFSRGIRIAVPESDAEAAMEILEAETDQG